MSKILVLNPFGAETREKEHCEAIAAPDTEITFDSIKTRYPLPYVQYRYFRHLCADATIDRVVEAEREGFDAVLVACMYDPGVIEARELVNIPVVGSFEASFHYAAMLGTNYALLTVEQNVVPVTWEMARFYGVSERLCAVDHIGITAAKLYADITPAETILERTFAAVERCVAAGAEVIILGCTLIGVVLTASGHDPRSIHGVPVIDPLLPAFKTAEMMAVLTAGGHVPAVSRLAGYRTPPPEHVDEVRAYYSKVPVDWARHGAVDAAQV